jgi:hypothetical protein
MPSTITATSIYVATNYPYSGAYTDSMNVYLVDKTRSTVTLVPCGTLELCSKPTVESFGVAVADLLKAIAISQKPELAKELLNV